MKKKVKYHWNQTTTIYMVFEANQMRVYKAAF